MKFTDQTILSITQLNNQVKYQLEQRFRHVWVAGEISTSKKYPSGHYYFSLKDERSEISCVMFANDFLGIDFQPVTGLKVLVSGNVSLYLPRGQYQLVVRNMYPAGQGALWLAYEKLKNRLEAEGLFDPSQKKALPEFPARIGIVTSSSGSVLRDIINVISRRAPQVELLLRPAQVQGKEASRDIAKGIEELNEYGKVDLIIIGRGGGSLEDLWCFNDELVAYAIHRSEIPIISAVGHETDFTIADFVADLRAPTPSAAAELAVPDLREMLQQMDHLQSRLIDLTKNHISANKIRIDALVRRHGFRRPAFILEKLRDRLETIKFQLVDYIRQNLERHQLSFDIITDKVTGSMENRLKSTSQQVNALDQLLQSLNPANVMDRGYAIVYNERREVISSPKKLNIGEDIHVKFSRGKLRANVKEIVENKNEK
ncbi:MAG: exodeoxyribonuclease VII large subunit [FCB group bacterium]|nr:exodeoxyribonuclease VII large subunit [FCB group bacterium]